jgi:hypothetical protein
MFAIVLSSGLLLASVLLAIHRRLSGLPARLVAILRQERAQDEARAVWALQEATAIRVGASTVALRAHEEQIAATFRAQIAEAEARARVAERRSSDAAVALSTATELVREVRATLEALGEVPFIVAELRGLQARVAEHAVEVPSPDSARQTIEIGPPVSCALPVDEEEPDEEPTKISARPELGEAQ